MSATVQVKSETKVKKEIESDSSSSSSSDDEDDQPLLVKREKKTLDDASDSDVPLRVTKKRPPPRKRAPPKKRKQPDSSSSDDDSSDSSSSSDSSGSSSSDSSDSSSDSDSDAAPRRKKRKAPTKKGKKKKTKVSAGAIADMLIDIKDFKTHEVQPMVAEKGANKWWNRDPLGDSKWKTLTHNGVLFPPAYVPHGVPISYDGEDVKLSPAAEEIASFFAIMIETDHAKKPVFRKNFFNDWRASMTPDEQNLIKDMEKVGFRKMYDHLMAERDRKKEEKKLKQVKERIKAETERINSIYGYALVDDYLEKIGNFKVEPPALFRGRGAHPKTGMVKKRVMPSDVILNISRGATVPTCPMAGHNWKGVVHHDKVTWLAMWTDEINNHHKYVYLASSSRFKGESDMQKYAKAQKLKTHIGKIRKNYTQEMKSSDDSIAQRAVAIYLIDFLALRVGNEKDTKEVADTVGCCSLRVEHLTFKDGNVVHFVFLGKDSMEYDNEAELDPQAYKNLKRFARGKAPSTNIFDLITVSQLNAHLSSLMQGLSAKVFRTYNASITLEKELREPAEDIDYEALVSKKVLFYNRANREVAILCNHQRSVPKAFNGQMERMEERTTKMKEELADLEAHLDNIAGSKKKKKKKRKVESKIKTTDPEKVQLRIDRLKVRISNLDSKKQMAQDNKTVALGTSKINYMDPRITVAWCKSKGVPLEKIFNKSLIVKFPWAMEVPSTWRF